MKLLTLPLIASLATTSLAAAQGPQLLVRDPRGGTAPLKIEEVSIDVTVAGDVAETTILVGFRNETERLLEGDFVMPLPPGATVSNYALEVNGAMRKGVAVEKARARTAYESIKRQMIDPGLVEREAGNVYRTRIFPIPVNSVKKVQLGYVEHLKTVDGKLRYELPCQFPGPVGKFSCRINSEGGTDLGLVTTPGMMFTEDPTGLLAAKTRNKPVVGDLVIDVSPPDGPVLLMESGGDALGDYFHLTDHAPDKLDVSPRAVPKRILLIWDASESRRLQAREIAILDAYFKKTGYAAIRLQLLRNTVSEAGVFAVRAGNWDTLKTVLEGIYYDGASGFDLLELDGIEEDIALFCTDGIAPFGLPTVPATKPVFLINGAAKSVPRSWARYLRPGGGAVLDLGRLTPDQAIHMLTTHPLQVVSVVGGGVSECHYNPDVSPGQAVRVSGRFKRGGPGTVAVNYGYGKTILSTTRVRVGADDTAESGFPRRLWAQAVLVDLESASPQDEAGIVFHCKRYGLVSDFTSLIVLERFEDHVRYEIPPPEEDLRKRYDAALARKKARKPKDNISLIVSRWMGKEAWHQRKFPWMEIALLPRLEQVTIWTKAVTKLFKKDELDPFAFAAIEEWRQKVLATVKRKDELRTEAQLKQWQQEIGLLVQSGSMLKQTSVSHPPDGRPLVVSVRGLVNAPGNFSGGHDLTLKKAIAMAGGIQPLGSETNVELYRNAGKTVYNMASNRYEDVALRPGDMIVVEQEDDPYDYRDVDPFSDTPEPEVDPSQRPAVVEAADVWISERHDRSDDPFGGGDGALGGASGSAGSIRSSPPSAPPLALPGSIQPAKPTGDLGPAMKNFGTALSKGGDAENAYRAMRTGGRYPARFYVESARLLVAHQHPDLAKQVLSNLIEIPEFDLERVLAASMWLAEFKQWESAAHLLAGAQRRMPSAPLPAYQRSLVAMQLDEKLTARQCIQHLLEQCQIEHHSDPSPTTIALSDLNGWVARRKLDWPTELPASLRKNIDADLRVVVMGSNPELFFNVAVFEPSGHVCRWDSPCGGRIEQTHGLVEYAMRRAMPGRYKITCQSRHPMTVRAILYQNWGRENQSSRAVTLLMDGAKIATLAEYEFSLDK